MVTLKVDGQVLKIDRIEPLAALLKLPPSDQLYKIIKVKYYLDMLKKGYLHFNRVDTYGDDGKGDKFDGEQLPLDRQGNESSKFEKNPNYSGADYYDTGRSRTYACCFSIENSPYLWEKYGDNQEGAICLIFQFSKLREILNQTMNTCELLCQNVPNIFFINHGLVEYIDRETYQINKQRLPNPIRYTYLKDRNFIKEKEFRISLCAFGIGNFRVNDKLFQFPKFLRLPFDFKTACRNEAIKAIKLSDHKLDLREKITTAHKELGIELNF